MATLLFLLMSVMAAMTNCKGQDTNVISFPSLENITGIVLSGNDNKSLVVGPDIKILEFGKATTRETPEKNNKDMTPTESAEQDTTPTDAPEQGITPTESQEQDTTPTKSPEQDTTATESPESAATPTRIPGATGEIPDCRPRPQSTTISKTTENTIATEIPETTMENIAESGSGSRDDEDDAGSGDVGSGELGSGEVDSGECPAGFTFSSELNRCYLFSTVTSDWFRAKKRCMTRDSHLASVQTKEENDYLLQEIARRKDDFLVGGNDRETQFTFVWDHNDEPFSFTQWGPDEPNNQFGRERCVEIKYYYKLERWFWNDLPCTIPKKFICERSPRY